MAAPQLLPYEVFWTYLFSFVISTAFTIIAGYILATRIPSSMKFDAFECGQPEDILPHQTYIKGADRYFAYAVAFFILDAFTWIIIAGARVLDFYIAAAFFMATYIIALMSALAYYVIKVREGL
jgi:NADH:ubiquinone oxidoreductase subunit 3 (subunit A)